MKRTEDVVTRHRRTTDPLAQSSRAAQIVIVLILAGCSAVPEFGAAATGSIHLPTPSGAVPSPSETGRTTPAGGESASARSAEAPYSSAAPLEPRAGRRISGRFGQPVVLDDVTIVVDLLRANQEPDR